MNPPHPRARNDWYHSQAHGHAHGHGHGHEHGHSRTRKFVLRSSSGDALPYPPPPPQPPWKHMADTYTWVVEQECAKLEKQGRQTAQWVHQHQHDHDHDSRRRTQSYGRAEKSSRVFYEDAELEREREFREHLPEFHARLRDEAEVRRLEIEREMARRRAAHEKRRMEEARRVLAEEELLSRLAEEAERARLWQKMAVKEQRRQEEERKKKAEKAMVEAWRSYEAQWDALKTSTEPLTFGTIPWPLLHYPDSVAAITPARIAQFLLSRAHSQDLGTKDRIRRALLKWHPDRFQRFLRRVREEDKGAVEEGVGIVARCLNDIMNKE